MFPKPPMLGLGNSSLRMPGQNPMRPGTYPASSSLNRPLGWMGNLQKNPGAMGMAYQKMANQMPSAYRGANPSVAMGKTMGMPMKKMY